MSDTSNLNDEPEADAQQRPEAHRKAGSAAVSSKTDTDPDFVISEAHDQEPELVGGFKAAAPRDDLGIQSTADLMENAAHSPRSGGTEAASFSDSELIGDSEPPKPESSFEAEPEAEELDTSNNNLEPPDEPGRIEKLSDEKLLEISARMHAEAERSGYLTEEEKMELLHSIDTAGSKAKGFDSQPIVPPKRAEKQTTPVEPVALTGEKPQIAKRIRGVAYFAKGFIQIKGEQELHEMDELTINGREYLLRRKRVSSKMVLIIVAPLAALLIFILGTLFSTGADTGQGRIVGMVLDEYEQPMIAGATISLPQLGQHYDVNGQGFFKTDQIPAGSYKIEYIVGGNVVGTDYATVADGELTTLAVRPSPTPSGGRSSRSSSTPAQIGVVTDPVPVKSSPSSSTSSSASKSSGSSHKDRPASSTPARDRWSEITLAANVDGAKLTLDGKVVGAGNLTYPKLDPGKHSYRVTKDGYEAVEGTIKLDAGETYKLGVKLTPTPQKKTSTAPGQGSYADGMAALKSGDYNAAVEELTQAISKNEHFADAYAARADARLQLGYRSLAVDDLVKAGHYMRADGRTADAVTAFDKAISMDARAVDAYLGRGQVYLDRSEEIAAIADFDMAIRLDKRSVAGYLGLGEARYRQGYFEKATRNFKDARSIDPDNPEIYQFMMLSYLGEGDLKQVKKSYDKFLEVASEEQAQRLNKDPKYAAALQAIQR